MEELKYELMGIKMSFEEFDHLICEQANGKDLKIEDGKVIAIEHIPTQKELNTQRIAELKQNLANTDYQAIKFAEGRMTQEEYAPIGEQRQQWRDEINRLEQ